MSLSLTENLKLEIFQSQRELQLVNSSTTNLEPKERVTETKTTNPPLAKGFDNSRSSDSGKSSSCSPILLDCSFDSGIVGVLLDSNEMQLHKRIQQCQCILLALERDREYFFTVRNRLSKISNRKKKQSNENEFFCNVCCAEIDPEDDKTFVKCYICQKYICRSIKCADWLPKTAEWECELCQTSKESLAQTSSWVADQISFHKEKLIHPPRARSEIYIPISECNDSSIHFESVSQIGANSAMITAEQKLKIREYVEEVVAKLLGGNLDTIAVNQLSKSENYLADPKNDLSHNEISGESVRARASNNDFTDISETRLRQMIQKIIAETINLPPLSKTHAVSEIALDRRSKASENRPLGNGYYPRHRTEHYFEPTIYQDLLATAVLNKIVDKQLNNNHEVAESDTGGGGVGDGEGEEVNDNIRLAESDQTFNIEKLSTTSGSSVEPRSDCSYPEMEQLLNTNDDKSSELIRNSDRDSVMSDYLASHLIPLPDLNAMATESEEEDYMSVTSSAIGDGTWEKNWLFKKKKSGLSSSVTTNSVGMLVPDPKEDVRAQIGDKTADEVSDLSELGSDTDDSLDSLRSKLEPINDRLANKHLIGGQNNKIILDELIERSSMISNTLQSNQDILDACNEHVIDAPTKTEAINDNVTQQESATEQKGNILREALCSVVLEDQNSNSLAASDDTSESDGCIGFSAIEIIEPTQDTPSVVEILAAMTLGPMLAVPSVDQPAALTVSDFNVFTDLKELALAEIKARSLELTPRNLDVIPEETGDVINQTDGVIDSKNNSTLDETEGRESTAEIETILNSSISSTLKSTKFVSDNSHLNIDDKTDTEQSHTEESNLEHISTESQSEICHKDISDSTKQEILSSDVESNDNAKAEMHINNDNLCECLQSNNDSTQQSEVIKEKESFEMKLQDDSDSQLPIPTDESLKTEEDAPKECSKELDQTTTEEKSDVIEPNVENKTEDISLYESNVSLKELDETISETEQNNNSSEEQSAAVPKECDVINKQESAPPNSETALGCTDIKEDSKSLKELDETISETEQNNNSSEEQSAVVPKECDVISKQESASPNSETAHGCTDIKKDSKTDDHILNESINVAIPNEQESSGSSNKVDGTISQEQSFEESLQKQTEKNVNSAEEQLADVPKECNVINKQESASANSETAPECLDIKEETTTEKVLDEIISNQQFSETQNQQNETILPEELPGTAVECPSNSTKSEAVSDDNISLDNLKELDDNAYNELPSIIQNRQNEKPIEEQSSNIPLECNSESRNIQASSTCSESTEEHKPENHISTNPVATDIPLESNSKELDEKISQEQSFEESLQKQTELNVNSSIQAAPSCSESTEEDKPENNILTNPVATDIPLESNSKLLDENISQEQSFEEPLQKQTEINVNSSIQATSSCSESTDELKPENNISSKPAATKNPLECNSKVLDENISQEQSFEESLLKRTEQHVNSVEEQSVDVPKECNVLNKQESVSANSETEPESTDIKEETTTDDHILNDEKVIDEIISNQQLSEKNQQNETILPEELSGTAVECPSNSTRSEALWEDNISLDYLKELDDTAYNELSSIIQKRQNGKLEEQSSNIPLECNSESTNIQAASTCLESTEEHKPENNISTNPEATDISLESNSKELVEKICQEQLFEESLQKQTELNVNSSIQAMCSESTEEDKPENNILTNPVAIDIPLDSNSKELNENISQEQSFEESLQKRIKIDVNSSIQAASTCSEITDEHKPENIISTNPVATDNPLECNSKKLDENISQEQSFEDSLQKQTEQNVNSAEEQSADVPKECNVINKQESVSANSKTEPESTDIKEETTTDDHILNDEKVIDEIISNQQFSEKQNQQNETILPEELSGTAVECPSNSTKSEAVSEDNISLDNLKELDDTAYNELSSIIQTEQNEKPVEEQSSNIPLECNSESTNIQAATTCLESTEEHKPDDDTAYNELSSIIQKRQNGKLEEQSSNIPLECNSESTNIQAASTCLESTEEHKPENNISTNPEATDISLESNSKELVEKICQEQLFEESLQKQTELNVNSSIQAMCSESTEEDKPDKQDKQDNISLDNLKELDDTAYNELSSIIQTEQNEKPVEEQSSNIPLECNSESTNIQAATTCLESTEEHKPEFNLSTNPEATDIPLESNSKELDETIPKEQSFEEPLQKQTELNVNSSTQSASTSSESTEEQKPENNISYNPVAADITLECSAKELDENISQEQSFEESLKKDTEQNVNSSEEQSADVPKECNEINKLEFASSNCEKTPECTDIKDESATDDHILNDEKVLDDIISKQQFSETQNQQNETILVEELAETAVECNSNSTKSEAVSEDNISLDNLKEVDDTAYNEQSNKTAKEQLECHSETTNIHAASTCSESTEEHKSETSISTSLQEQPKDNKTVVEEPLSTESKIQSESEIVKPLEETSSYEQSDITPSSDIPMEINSDSPNNEASSLCSNIKELDETISKEKTFEGHETESVITEISVKSENDDIMSNEKPTEQNVISMEEKSSNQNLNVPHEIISTEQLPVESNLDTKPDDSVTDKNSAELNKVIAKEQSFKTQAEQNITDSEDLPSNKPLESNLDSHNTEDPELIENSKSLDQTISRDMSEAQTNENITTERNLDSPYNETDVTEVKVETNNISNECSIPLNYTQNEQVSSGETPSDTQLENNSDSTNNELTSKCTDSNNQSKTEDNIPNENSKVPNETISQEQSSEAQTEINETIPVEQLSAESKINDIAYKENVEDIIQAISNQVITICKDQSSKTEIGQNVTSSVDQSSDIPSNVDTVSACTESEVECNTEDDISNETDVKIISEEKTEQKTTSDISLDINSDLSNNDTGIREIKVESMTDGNISNENSKPDNGIISTEQCLETQSTQNVINSEEDSPDIILCGNTDSSNIGAEIASTETKNENLNIPDNKSNEKLKIHDENITEEQSSEAQIKENTATDIPLESNSDSPKNETTEANDESITSDLPLESNSYSFENKAESACTESVVNSKNESSLEDLKLLDETITQEQSSETQTKQMEIVLEEKLTTVSNFHSITEDNASNENSKAHDQTISKELITKTQTSLYEKSSDVLLERNLNSPNSESLSTSTEFIAEDNTINENSKVVDETTFEEKSEEHTIKNTTTEFPTESNVDSLKNETASDVTEIISSGKISSNIDNTETIVEQNAENISTEISNIPDKSISPEQSSDIHQSESVLEEKLYKDSKTDDDISNENIKVLEEAIPKEQNLQIQSESVVESKSSNILLESNSDTPNSDAALNKNSIALEEVISEELSSEAHAVEVTTSDIPLENNSVFTNNEAASEITEIKVVSKLDNISIENSNPEITEIKVESKSDDNISESQTEQNEVSSEKITSNISSTENIIKQNVEDNISTENSNELADQIPREQSPNTQTQQNESVVEEILYNTEDVKGIDEAIFKEQDLKIHTELTSKSSKDESSDITQENNSDSSNSEAPSNENSKASEEQLAEELSSEAHIVENTATVIPQESNSVCTNNEAASEITEVVVESKSDDNISIANTSESQTEQNVISSEKTSSNIANTETIMEQNVENNVSTEKSNKLDEPISQEESSDAQTEQNESVLEKLNTESNLIPKIEETISEEQTLQQAEPTVMSSEKLSSDVPPEIILDLPNNEALSNGNSKSLEENSTTDIQLESNSVCNNNETVSEITEINVVSKSDENSQPLNEIIVAEQSPEIQTELNIIQSGKNSSNATLESNSDTINCGAVLNETASKEHLSAEANIQSKTDDKNLKASDETIPEEINESTESNLQSKAEDNTLSENVKVLDDIISYEQNPKTEDNIISSDTEISDNLTESNLDLPSSESSANENSKALDVAISEEKSFEAYTEENTTILSNSDFTNNEAASAATENKIETHIEPNIISSEEKSSDILDKTSRDLSSENQPELNESISEAQLPTESNLQSQTDDTVTNENFKALDETICKEQTPETQTEPTAIFLVEQSSDIPLECNSDLPNSEVSPACTESKVESIISNDNLKNLSETISEEKSSEANTENFETKEPNEIISQEQSNNEIVSIEQLAGESNVQRTLISETQAKQNVTSAMEQLISITPEINSDSLKIEATTACTESIAKLSDTSLNSNLQSSNNEAVPSCRDSETGIEHTVTFLEERSSDIQQEINSEHVSANTESKTADNISGEEKASETHTEQNEIVTHELLSTEYRTNDQLLSNENSECTKNESGNSLDKLDEQVTSLDTSIIPESNLQFKAEESETNNDCLIESDEYGSKEKTEQIEISSEEHPCHVQNETITTDKISAILDVNLDSKKSDDGLCISSEINIQSKTEDETKSEQNEIISEDNLDKEVLSISTVSKENSTVIDNIICEEHTTKTQTDQNTTILTNKSSEIPLKSNIESKIENIELRLADKGNTLIELQTEQIEERNEIISKEEPLDSKDEVECSQSNIEIAAEYSNSETLGKTISNAQHFEIQLKESEIDIKDQSALPLKNTEDLSHKDLESKMDETISSVPESDITQSFDSPTDQIVITSELNLKSKTEDNDSVIHETTAKPYPEIKQEEISELQSEEIMTAQSETQIEKISDSIKVETLPTDDNALLEVSKDTDTSLPSEKELSEIVLNNNTSLDPDLQTKVEDDALNENSNNIQQKTEDNKSSKALNDNNSTDQIIFKGQSSEIKSCTDTTHNESLCSCFERKSQSKSENKIVQENSDQNNVLMECISRVLCPCLESNKQSKTYEDTLICQQKIDEICLESNVESNTENGLKEQVDTIAKVHTSEIQQNEIPLEIISNSTGINVVSQCLESSVQHKIEDKSLSNNDALSSSSEARTEDNTVKLAEASSREPSAEILQIADQIDEKKNNIPPISEAKADDNSVETVGNEQAEIEELTCVKSDDNANSTKEPSVKPTETLFPNSEASIDNNSAETVRNEVENNSAKEHPITLTETVEIPIEINKQNNEIVSNEDTLGCISKTANNETLSENNKSCAQSETVENVLGGHSNSCDEVNSKEIESTQKEILSSEHTSETTPTNEALSNDILEKVDNLTSPIILQEASEAIAETAVSLDDSPTISRQSTVVKIEDEEIVENVNNKDANLLESVTNQPPGSIAEREYKKWYNAVEMPNNPYAPEALKRRISGSQERFIDLPNISPTNDLNPLELLNNQKLDEDENTTRESDYKRYSRDYYINSSLTTPQISPARDVSARTTKDIREPTKETLSSTETELDLYKAIPAQVVENNSSSTDSMPLLSAEMETNVTTTSEDSDTIKVYDFETQRETKTTLKNTTVAEREQTPVDEVNTKERPSSLAFSRSESAGNVITPTRGATPQAFKFLQPKRKLLEPSQVLSVEEDEPQVVSSPSEKPVIEAEVAKALPSVKALARAFLMTTNSTQPEKLWLRKARTLSQGGKKRSYSPKRSLDHLMRTEYLKPEDDLTITSDLSSLETDSSSVGVEIATSSDLTSSAISSTNEPSLPAETSNISPVPVRQGVLKNNIAFFENLKNK